MIFFGTNLQYIRKKKGINQAELASMLEVKPNTISNYENAKSEPDYASLQKIIKFFDISSDDILFKDLVLAAKEAEAAKAANAENPDFVIEEGETEYSKSKSKHAPEAAITKRLDHIYTALKEIKNLLHK
jgi:transcriptional regulator with XRE-family HTH domain